MRTRADLDLQLSDRPFGAVRGRLTLRKRQPGMHYRWVTAHSMGQETAQNVLNRLEEGYVPVRPEDIGHTVRSMPGRPQGTDSDLVVNGGLILMAMPEEMADRHREARAKQGREQLSKIREEMTGDSEVAIQIERKSSTRRGRGARADGDIRGG